jgi:cytoskeletal protein RodZ
MYRSRFRHREEFDILPATASSLPADRNGSSGEEEEGSDQPRESPPPPAMDAEPQSPLPISIGGQLSAARHRLGVSMDQASSDTRIEARYLKALEADAPIDEFLGPAYARLFLKHYASYLRLDGAALLQAFDRAHPAAPVERLPEPAVKVRGPFVAFMLVLVSLAAMVAIALRSFSSVGPPAALGQNAPPPSIVPSTSPSISATPSTGAPIREGVHARLVVAEACWIEATVDGKVLLAQTFQPGKRLLLDAKRTLLLVLGNAGGVQLRVNGTAVHTGERGQVVHLAWQWRNGRLVPRSP